MKKRIISTTLALIALLICGTNVFAAEKKRSSWYMDSTAIYSYGTGVSASCSSSNWDKELPSKSNSYIAQLSFGRLFNYLYFDNCSFSKMGLMVDYSYMDYQMGDIQSLNFGIDFKVLWILKIQLGFGWAFSDSTYTINHGYNWSEETREDKAVFNGYSMVLAIGADIPVTDFLSLTCYARSDSYSEGPFMAIGHIHLSKGSYCIGIKMMLWGGQ